MYDNILGCIGNTPLVRLNRIGRGGCELFAKIEYFNPAGSSKDRVGLAMIEDAERRGLLKPGAMIVEPTSGNTGIGLALAAVVKGYRAVLTMPDSMSVERRRLLAAYGAELVLTPGADGIQGAIDKAKQIVAENPGSFMPQQFENPSNPMAHYRTTAEEIWRDTGGRVDLLVATVGTGGTFCGTVRRLKELNPRLKAVAVEPAGSPVLSGGKAGPHRLQGIGAGFIPGIMDVSLIDEVAAVTDDEAGEFARRSARDEGILVGISSGAALAAAVRIASRPEWAGKRAAVILPDSGERYLSGWLFEA